MLKKQLLVIYIISFFTAFCSLIYELQYSQLLSVLYGNSVLRYSLTIGLYLFSLGVGSLSFRLFSKFKEEKVLLISQFSLAILGPLGVIGIIWLENIFFSLFQLRGQSIAVSLAHLPIIVTGILAGIQIPLLSILGNAIKKRKDMFVEVLGIDYFGSLVGAVSYGLFLYPEIGLIKTAFFIGAINAGLAILCLSFFMYSKTLKYFCLILVGVFVVLVFSANWVEKKTMDMYLKVSIEKERSKKVGYDPAGEIKIESTFNTKYADITKYEISKNGASDKCVKFANYVNICDSWGDDFNDALVHTPMSLLKNMDRPYEALVLGGGSLVPAANLLEYDNVNVDQVDIDRELVEFTRKDPYFLGYNKNAGDSDRINFYYQDALTFLRNNQKKYDIIIMSLPGYNNDKVVHLGSVEFFNFMSKALNDDGIMASYSPGDIDGDYVYNSRITVSPTYPNAEPLKPLFKDISEGGFDSYAKYYAFYNLDKSDAYVPGDTMYLFRKKHQDIQPNFKSSAYMNKIGRYFKRLKWSNFEHLNLASVRPSRIFSPNYDIMNLY